MGRLLWVALWFLVLAQPGQCQLTTWNATPLDPGTYELDFFYFSSSARREFDELGRVRTLEDLDSASVTYAGFGWGLGSDVDLWLYSSLNSSGDSGEFSLGSRKAGAQSDLSLLARWRCYHNEDEGLGLALIAGPLWQSGLSPGDSNFLALSQELVLEKDLGCDLTLYTDVYYAFPLRTADITYHQFGADLAFSWQATDWLAPVAELNYYQALPPDGGSQESWTATVGACLSPDENLTLYLGYQFNLAGRNVEQFGTLITGLTANF